MTEVMRITDPNYVTDKAVYFYTPQYYVFDNFSAFAVELWGRVFPTSEHAYQWKKFALSGSPVAEEIFNARSARDTKVIADRHKDDVSSEWDDLKLSYMEEILRAKIQQHKKVKSLLLETKRMDIIENSPTDMFWGIGNGEGKNELGKLWMKLRSELE
jgi:ribA/ribD-fused uncharacterized protein